MTSWTETIDQGRLTIEHHVHTLTVSSANPQLVYCDYQYGDGERCTQAQRLPLGGGTYSWGFRVYETEKAQAYKTEKTPDPRACRIMLAPTSADAMAEWVAPSDRPQSAFNVQDMEEKARNLGAILARAVASRDAIRRGLLEGVIQAGREPSDVSTQTTPIEVPCCVQFARTAFNHAYGCPELIAFSLRLGQEENDES